MCVGMSGADSRIPVSWVSVHHTPAVGTVHTDWSLSRGRMLSLDDGLLSDVRNRHNLYQYEENNISEEDDDVFLDSVESIVTQHRRGLAIRQQQHLHAGRIASDPDYHTATSTDPDYITSSVVTSEEDVR